jgi:hypothetical protein
MKGNNFVMLNQSSMREALQEWFDKRMGEFAPEVGNIKIGGDGLFEISCHEKAEAK